MNPTGKDLFDLTQPDFISVIDELPLWSAPFGLKLLDAIKIRKNITVLDIGSGLGFPVLEIAMRLGESCKVYGIDPWKEAIDRIRKKISLYQISNVEIIEGVAEAIPLPNNSIDLIVSNNGINNVNDLTKTLSECSRISKPGAQFVATVNLNKTMIEFYTVFENVLLKRNMNVDIEKIHRHIYIKRKPLPELLSLIENAGFEIKNLTEDTFKLNFTDGTAMFNHFLIRLAFLDSWKEIIPENMRDDVFREIEKELNDISSIRGQLELTVPFVVIDCKRSGN